MLLFESLGAAPASINFSETYFAPETRLVEGQERSLRTLDTVKLCGVQVQKCCAFNPSNSC